jgi:hypothetical protein
MGKLRLGLFIVAALASLTAQFAFADQYFKSTTRCLIGGKWQSLIEPGEEFRLPNSLVFDFSAVYSQDLNQLVTPISKAIDKIELYGGGRVPAAWRSRFNPDLIEYRTGRERGCPGMVVNEPHHPFILSRADILDLIRLLGGNLDTADEYKIQWKDYEPTTGRCYLSPGAKEVSREPTVEFIFGRGLTLLFQASLPPEVKDGLSFHLDVACQD